MSAAGIRTGRGAMVAMALTVSTPAHAWWDVDWSSRNKLTFQNASITADADDVVVMVKLDATRIDYGDMQADGDDLRFVDADDLTELDYDVEVWDPAGTSIVWVRVPRVEGTGTADSIYMYWGNLLAPPAADPFAPWDDGIFTNVYHFDPTLENRLDGVAGTLHNGAASIVGKHGDALDFDGIDDYFFTVTDTINQELKDATQLEFWIKTTDVGLAAAESAPGVTGYQDVSKKNEVQVFGWLDNTGKIGLKYRGKQSLSTTAVNDGVWHHVTLSRSGSGTQKVYVDGTLQTNSAGVGNDADDYVPATLYKGIGRAGMINAYHYLDATLDEVRVHNTDRSDAWNRANWLSVSDTLISWCALTAFSEDLDNDGFGDDSGATTLSCDAHPDFGAPTDCNDGNAAVSPGDPEICDVGNTDEDCDGAADDADAGATGKVTYYLDNDKDGYGQTASPLALCDKTAAYALASGDCDDADATEYPGAIWYTDADGDGFGNPAASVVSCTKAGVSNDDDCNDADATVNPNTLWYKDGDGDGHGNPLDSVASCAAPAGRVRDKLDCNDINKDVYTGAPEQCDGVDNDCDVTVDESPPAPYGTVYYVDGDKDGYGVPGVTIRSCSPVVGYAPNDDDCLDANAAANPAGVENACNGFDDDCDGFGKATDSSDGDGLTWLQENAVGASDCATDSDGDTLDDDTEYDGGVDSDFDGAADIADPDDDGDTIPTAIEAAAVDPDASANTCPGVVADAIPNHLDLDSDGDGLSDFNEGTSDTDADGTPNFLDCSNFGCDGDVDVDADGLDDCTELDLGLSDTDADADDDLVPDGVEVGDVTSPFDSDADGKRDVVDADDDDDGVPTALEVAGSALPLDTDHDGDQLPDYLDTDDDGDGVPTLDEDRDGNGDAFDDDLDGDAVADFRDGDDSDGPTVDGDGDGLLNGVEAGTCAGGDCLDPLDPDTDGDGVADGDEFGDGATPRDSDGDGLPDALDRDDDGDGVPSAEEGAGDGDLDGAGAYLDPDSDDDGIADGSESAQTDADCDGVPDRHDPAADGACAAGGDDTGAGGGKDDPGGCSTTGGAGGLAWLAGLALLARRRR